MRRQARKRKCDGERKHRENRKNSGKRKLGRKPKRKWKERKGTMGTEGKERKGELRDKD